tara:strand:+ start:2580 stop:3626 length:1047 start_codon:yes stop_codon:yes gene_type:complete
VALTYNVCQLRDTTYSASGAAKAGKQSVVYTFGTKYLVQVTDSADPGFGPEDITELHVASAAGIPIVNVNTYYHAPTNTGNPFAVCTGKRVTRSKQNGTVFTVDATYSSQASDSSKTEKPGGGDNTGTPPAAFTDIPATLSRSLTMREVRRYNAPAYSADLAINGAELNTTFLPQNANQATRVGEKLGVPVMTKTSNISYTLTQFEATFTDNNLIARGYKVNSDVWRSNVVKSCMITGIDAVEQTVQLAAGPTSGYRVTYSIDVDNYTVTDSNANSLFIGHATGIPLVSGHHLNAAGDKVLPFSKGNLGIGAVGLVDINMQPLADQTGSPDYVMFDTVNEISFSFLQI